MSLHEDLRQFVLDRVASAEPRLTSVSVTDAYIRRQEASGAWFVVHNDQRVAEYGGVQQIVRAHLRDIMPENPESEKEQLEILPETKLLRERYSVKDEGGGEYYVERSALTEDEMEQIATRFEKLSARYYRHAKALRADWHRTHSLVEIS